MTKTLVTGGTGFIGRAVVEELLAAEREVRVLARHPEALGDLQVEVVRGDLRDPASLASAVRGCHLIFLNKTQSNEHKSHTGAVVI